jgi:hypothetical protein
VSNPYVVLNEYELRHLPAHLRGANMWPEIEALLTDVLYLEAKAHAGFVSDLTLDFTLAVRTSPANLPLSRTLALLEEALRRDVHFISRHRAAMFQCLWNSCW